MGTAQTTITPASAPPELTNHLCWLLGRAAQSLTGELMDAIGEVGLTPRTHPVLLAAMTGEHTQIELARMVGLDKTTMVATIDELERLGLAERRPSPTDRRARVIHVTTEGRRKAEEADAITDRIREDVLASLPAGERDRFMDALRHLVGGRLAA